MADDNNVDIDAQTEEVEALQAIYGDAVVVVPVEGTTNCHCVRIDITSERSQLLGTLEITLPLDYPSRGCPVFEVKCPCLSADEVHQAARTLAAMFCPGEVVVFQCVEWLRGYVQDRQPQQDSSKGEEEGEDEEHSAGNSCTEVPGIDGTGGSSASKEHTDVTEQCWPTVDQDPSFLAEDADVPSVLHGTPLTDRKSTFQAHVAQVHSKKEVSSVDSLAPMPPKVMKVLSELKQNRKVAMATHNIMAYRIFDDDRKVFIHDCDNDGETSAGSQLLHMLELMDVRNAVVVVSRWYGGVHLGPDRFKHINNCARTLIQDTRIGLKHQLGSGTKDKHKKKKH